ncbi:MAG: hypothetical protein A2X28_07345 [Elusimicrobia bacterium GWA2_56_46]|nr:MAG: hypothetical protein A2X28_07345 [Elusimicrobia bacterium GWA2_56_46]OGR54741.1 MAG: hypothetical protein A2X39_10645 [Elusimicrobia bacterium GWC2_56_31]HBB67997.1 hypothetical protein [Elusimicrobiota bacterium]HBW23469.1 hypothetical protein [Elusimicrobiota bacterium]
MIFDKKQLAPMVLALAFCACGGELASPAARALHHYLSKPAYVDPAAFKTAAFPPPPAADSEAQKADLALVLDRQEKRTEAECAGARVTAGAGYRFFWGDKSPFPAPLPGEVKDFFRRLDYDAGESVTALKDRFRRPRPFNAYTEVRPCVKKSAGYSYPSGHSSCAWLFALVLGDIIPARRAEFIKRADEIAMDRVTGGVHYPSDVAAGKVFGDAFHAELLKSPAYLGDIERMKTLLAK